jgi:hypothetical protein
LSRHSQLGSRSCGVSKLGINARDMLFSLLLEKFL